MIPEIGDILEITTEKEFEEAAIELFRFQSRECPPYRDYIRMAGVDPTAVKRVCDIPFLPIELFKSTDVYCGSAPPEKTFTSSTTGGGEPSRHMMARLSDYEKTFVKAFSLFYGDPAGVSLFALLPGYLEREGSSLVYMVDKLIAHGGGGFYLRNTEKLLRDIRSAKGKKLLLGVTYALLDLAKQSPDLHDVIVMETGGMKGRREEIPKPELHRILCKSFGVESIHSEYGMAELTSQAYSAGRGVFQAPPWMRVLIRDLNDPFDILPAGSSGGINIVDLANLSSCAFIQTQDIGTLFPDNTFTVNGRIDRSETRGCNLLVDNIL